MLRAEDKGHCFLHPSIERGVQNIRSSPQTPRRPPGRNQLWAPPRLRAAEHTAPGVGSADCAVPERADQARTLRGSGPRWPCILDRKRERGPSRLTPQRPLNRQDSRPRITLTQTSPTYNSKPRRLRRRRERKPRLPQCSGGTTCPEMHRSARRRSAPAGLPWYKLRAWPHSEYI